MARWRRSEKRTVCEDRRYRENGLPKRTREWRKRDEEYIVVYSWDEGNKWFEEPVETGPRTKDTLPAPPESQCRRAIRGTQREEKKEVDRECETRESVKGEKADSGGRKGSGESDGGGW